MANQTNSLAHTKWMCKYHIVFCPKYRRKIVYHQYREDLRDIIRTLCKYKGLEILEGHMMPDHVTSTVKYTTENECVKLYGIPEREERADDVRQTCKSEVQVRE